MSHLRFRRTEAIQLRDVCPCLTAVILRIKITIKIILFPVPKRFMRPTARDLRSINRQKLLQLIYFHTPTTRLELSELSGLSPATVTNVVNALLNEGIVTELGAQESLGGRPRI